MTVFMRLYGSLQMLTPGLQAFLAFCPGREVGLSVQQPVGSCSERPPEASPVNYCEFLMCQAPLSGLEVQVIGCYSLIIVFTSGSQVTWLWNSMYSSSQLLVWTSITRD